MIDESDPAVRAMRAQFDEISARHKANVTQTMAGYEQTEAANQARQEAARQEAREVPAPPPPPKNPWLGRRSARPSEEDDGSETGFYSNSWMQ
jgi:hypothetical protein